MTLEITDEEQDLLCRAIFIRLIHLKIGLPNCFGKWKEEREQRIKGYEELQKKLEVKSETNKIQQELFWVIK